MGLMMSVSPLAAQTSPEPPLWANLAECSAVFGAVAGFRGYGGASSAELERASEISARLVEAAVAEAEMAGQADPAADVASILPYLTTRWKGRVDNIASVRSNKKWIDYCGRLARQQGVLPLP